MGHRGGVAEGPRGQLTQRHHASVLPQPLLKREANDGDNTLHHDRTASLLLKALAKGDLETVEHCALALIAEDGEVHADYEHEPLITCERHLYAYLYALPPFHRNPCRREFAEVRQREQRLVGCFVELAWRGSDDELPPSARGTIVEDRGDTWVVRVRQRSSHGTHSIEVPLVVPLDHLAACDVKPNEAQFRAHGLNPESQTTMDCLARYLGQPDWPWFERLGPRIPHN